MFTKRPFGRVVTVAVRGRVAQAAPRVAGEWRASCQHRNLDINASFGYFGCLQVTTVAGTVDP